MTGILPHGGAHPCLETDVGIVACLMKKSVEADLTLIEKVQRGRLLLVSL